MRRLLKEFLERRIWRTLIVYPGVTFGLLEAAEFFIDNYGLDERALTAIIIAALTLLPAALLWNWRHGEAGKQEVIRSEVAAYVGFVALTLGCQVWYWSAESPARSAGAPAEPPRSVAVMPFVNAGGEEVQYLADGIAESLINWLSAVPTLRVVSKSAAFRLRDQVEDTGAIARALRVDSILRGRLETHGEQLIISASLVDARDDAQLWGERMVRPLAEAIFLEQSIVAAIRDGLRLEVSDAADEARASGGTRDPEAYRHYLRGHHEIQATEAGTIEAGIDELRTAISLDPGFALPYTDIADALSQLIYYAHVERDEALMGEARNAAHTAVALAPRLPEAHTAMAAVHQYFTFDWKAADQSYETAIALSPQSPVPYIRYADYLWATVRLERGRQMAARALELDPLNGSAMHAVGITALFDGDFTAAAEAFGEWNRFYPASHWSYVKHSVALALDGQCDASLAQAEQVERISGGNLTLLMGSWLAWAHQVCGQGGPYAKQVSRLKAALEDNPDSTDPAFLYYHALEGDADGLYLMLRRLVEQKSPLSFALRLLGVENMRWPATEALRRDPRYQELLATLDFPG